jgi:hypothetical protein
VGLPINKIKDIYEFLSENLIRVYSDLNLDETPTGESTSLLTALEIKPLYTYSNCNALIKFIEEENDVSIDAKGQKDIDEALKNLFTGLINLPKITREFFFALVSKSTHNSHYDLMAVSDESMRRFLNIPNKRYNEELRLLEKSDLIDYSEEERFYHLIRLKGLPSKEYTLINILEFAKTKDIRLEKILIDLDFSCFSQEG